MDFLILKLSLILEALCTSGAQGNPITSTIGFFYAFSLLFENQTHNN